MLNCRKTKQVFEHFYLSGSRILSEADQPGAERNVGRKPAAVD